MPTLSLLRAMRKPPRRAKGQGEVKGKTAKGGVRGEGQGEVKGKNARRGRGGSSGSRGGGGGGGGGVEPGVPDSQEASDTRSRWDR